LYFITEYDLVSIKFRSW